MSNPEPNKIIFSMVKVFEWFLASHSHAVYGVVEVEK